MFACMSFFRICILALSLWLTYVVLNGVRQRLRRMRHTTRLKGPPNESFFMGMVGVINKAEDPGALYEKWADEYGSVYKAKSLLGNSSRIVLCDPKAIAHFYAKETFVYVNTKTTKLFVANLFGRGLLWSEGESHKRQRKALSPAFSNAAIRRLTSVFFDSSYKLKTVWDNMLDASPTDDLVIDVQHWMNKISLDSIGIGGFSHDFGSLDGKHSPVEAIFDTFGRTDQSFISQMVFLLSIVFPVLSNIPTSRRLLLTNLNTAMKEIANELLERTRIERNAKIEEKAGEKSIIGLLIKAEHASNELHMSQEEILAQMNVLILAGYETTSMSLTWALIELSRNPAEQTKLREELSQFTGTDPTWEQLTNGLPYLDAVVHEVLRMHPALDVTNRVASEDDVIPLLNPIVTTSGNTVDHIAVAEGTVLTVPIHSVNRSATFWGEDAKKFVPARWLNEAGTEKAKDISGHRHLLTFVDGPRMCLGRGFALAEFKAALSVLVRNYVFEFPDGPETKIEGHRSILLRPKVAGQNGAKVPLRVRRVE